jgi:hypothetical protein
MAAPTPPAKSFRFTQPGDTDNKVLTHIAIQLSVGQGMYGVDFVSDASKHDGGPWAYIVILTDAVITAINILVPNSGTIVGQTIKAGSVIPLRFDSITLSSGAVELVRDSP